MNNSNATSSLPILTDYENVIIGKIYALPKPIEVESFPIKSEKTSNVEEIKKVRKFIIIKPVERKKNEIVCTGHKTKEVAPGKFKNNKRTYFFTLPKNLVSNN